MQATDKIWMNGELIDWDDAKSTSARTVSTTARASSREFAATRPRRSRPCSGSPITCSACHNSARLLYMQGAVFSGRVHAASMELIASNGLASCYLRPIAFYGFGELGVSAQTNPVEVVLMSWPWGSYLGDEGLKSGIRARSRGWQRVGPNVIPHVAKATGVYLNSMLAVTEANKAGYDEAILLTADGFVADGSGENVFIVKDGVLYTPDLATGILPGITRDTVIQIAQDLGYTVVQKQLIRSDLHLADEVFMCGTAAEVTPIREIDDHAVGRRSASRSRSSARTWTRARG